MDPMYVPIMGEFFEFLTSVAGMLFVLVVLWIIFRRPHRHADQATGAIQEQALLDELARLAGKMDRRLETLEKILDTEDPKWRDHAA